MPIIAYAFITGASGERYEFSAFSLDSDFRNVGGVYALARRTLDEDGRARHEILYLGRTESLKKSLRGKEQWASIFPGCNCILVRAETDPERRALAETDLRRIHDCACPMQ